MRALAFALLMAPLLAGSAAAEPQVRSGTIPPGGMLETDLVLAQGQRVVWSFEVRGSESHVVWDVHTHHANGTAQQLEAGTTNRTARGTFVAPFAGTFSWFATNAISRAALNVTITTDVQGGAPPPAANPLPFPALPALLAAGAAALALRPARRRPGA